MKLTNGNKKLKPDTFGVKWCYPCHLPIPENFKRGKKEKK